MHPRRFVSDKHIQVGEIDQSKRERKKQHLQELKSAAASHHDEDVRLPSCSLSGDYPWIVRPIVISQVLTLPCSKRLALAQS